MSQFLQADSVHPVITESEFCVGEIQEEVMEDGVCSAGRGTNRPGFSRVSVIAHMGGSREEDS